MRFRDLYNLIEEHPPCHLVIERELETISNSNRALWDAFLTVLPKLANQVLPHLKKVADTLAAEHLGVMVSHKTNIATNFVLDFDDQYLKFYKEDPEFQRAQEHFQIQLRQTEEKLKLSNPRFKIDPKTAPYFYEQECIKVSDTPKDPEEQPAQVETPAEPAVSNPVDLVCIVPSMCSSSSALARLVLALHRHHGSDSLLVHVSVSNDGDPGAPLYLMSLRLAEELKATLKSLHSRGGNLRSLSFIGFGTGGLVARGALKELKDFQKSFGVFMTLGTPHLGNAEVKENVLNKGRQSHSNSAGGFLAKLSFGGNKPKNPANNESPVMKDLKLDDEDELDKTHIFRISKDQGISYFKKLQTIALAGDKFCPVYSASIQNLPSSEYVS